jgi:hypothetical protein
MILDRAVEKELRQAPAETERLERFIEQHRQHKRCHLEIVRSMEELTCVLQRSGPKILYWLCHAGPGVLEFDGELIRPQDFIYLLSGQESPNRPWQSLAFLNACDTAPASQQGSFLEAMHQAGLSGTIATEHQVLETLANQYGIYFLDRFLNADPPLSVGAILHEIHCGESAHGLLYGCYCPPDLMIGVPEDATEAPEGGQVKLGPSDTSGGTLLSSEMIGRGHRPLPRPPARQPYRSLLPYDRDSPALFVGRENDVVRFGMILDQAETRVLVLQGESGVGKSSFLQAAVIPFIEEECVGYRFLRSPSRSGSDGIEERGPVLFVHAGGDLARHIADVLIRYTSSGFVYRDPDENRIDVPLTNILAQAIGGEKAPTLIELRKALLDHPEALARVLESLSRHLPFALVLVIDQAEEVFTLDRRGGSDQRHGHLAMLRSLLDSRGDFKVVISLRTEYYGRLVDSLRSGRRGGRGLQQYYLAELTRGEIREAIERPTTVTSMRFDDGSEERLIDIYNFKFKRSVVDVIVRDILDLRSLNHDSVLPLLQVICDQLHAGLPEAAGNKQVREIDVDSLKNIDGVRGGIKRHVEGLVARLAKDLKNVRQALDRKTRRQGKNPQKASRKKQRNGRARDASTIRTVLNLLHIQQPDGLCTAVFVQEAKLREIWEETNPNGAPFEVFVKNALGLRLLKLRVRETGNANRRFLGLGHDAIAKVVADWRSVAQARQTKAIRARRVKSRVARQARELEAKQALERARRSRRKTRRRVVEEPSGVGEETYVSFWSRLNPWSWW